MTPAEQLDIIRSFEAVESMDDEAVSKRDLEVEIFDWYQQYSLSLSIWYCYVLTFDKTVFVHVQLHSETMLMWPSNEPSEVKMIILIKLVLKKMPEVHLGSAERVGWY